MKPYYEDDAVTIYHGDCREVLPLLATGALPFPSVRGPLSGHVGVLVTDPPYGIRKAEWDDELPLDVLDLAADMTTCSAVMPGVWNIAAMPTTLAEQHYRWTLAAHLTNGMTNGAVGFGNWIPCLLYSLDGVSLYRQDGDARDFAVGTEDKVDHPSPKPLRVMHWILDRLPAGIVLDPFAGSGTTLRAAKDRGRRAVGIERDERYCELAARRLGQEVLDLGGVA